MYVVLTGGGGGGKETRCKLHVVLAGLHVPFCRLSTALLKYRVLVQKVEQEKPSKSPTNIIHNFVRFLGRGHSDFPSHVHDGKKARAKQLVVKDDLEITLP